VPVFSLVTAKTIGRPLISIKPRSGDANASTNVVTGMNHSDFAELEQIGPYRILGKVGQGGMGTVFEAQQQNPRRQVALKVIRSGLVSDQLLQRFEHEAQILGLLKHPGIAQIYEAGYANLPFGRVPYFAMELVDGRPIDKYAAERKLNLRQRLELVAWVADAVQHAHQKGIIHRDLKPPNILVTDVQNDGTKSLQFS
jgi:serine/threonine protein kinase